jgi:hypothetical protein
MKRRDGLVGERRDLKKKREKENFVHNFSLKRNKQRIWWELTWGAREGEERSLVRILRSRDSKDGVVFDWRWERLEDRRIERSERWGIDWNCGMEKLSLFVERIAEGGCPLLDELCQKKKIRKHRLRSWSALVGGLLFLWQPWLVFPMNEPLFFLS